MAWYDADPVVDDKPSAKTEGDWWKSDPVVGEQSAEAPSGVTLADLMSGKYGNRIPKDVHIPTVNETGWIPAPIVEAALRYGNPLGWAQVAAEHYDPNNPIVQAGKGAIQGLSSTIAGATTPENLSLLALAPEGKLAQRLIAGTFLGQSIAGTPEQWDAFNKADNLADKFKIGTEMGLGLALPAAGLAHSFKAGEVPKVEPAQSAFPSEEIRQDVVSGRTEEAAKDNLLASRQELRPSAVQEVPQPEITPPIVEPSIKEKQDLGKPEPKELSGVQGQMASTYINGDQAQYTGETREIAGGTFYVVKMLEGHKAGQEAVTARPPTGPDPFATKAQQEWQAQQGDFRKLRGYQESQTLGADVGARKVRPGQQDRIDAAKQEMRDAINAQYSSPRERADAIANAREKVNYAVAGIEMEAPSVLEPNEAGAPPVSPKEIPQSATGEPNAISQRSTTEEIPSPIERGENKQVSGERVRPSEQGEEIARTGQTPEESQTAGIAKRFIEDDVASGALPPEALVTGEGWNPQQALDRGRALINKGVDVRQVSEALKGTRRFPPGVRDAGDAVAVLHAERERLAAERLAAQQAAADNSALSGVARAAEKAEVEFLRTAKPQAGGLAQRIMVAFQEAHPADLSTFDGLYRKAIDLSDGRELAPGQKAELVRRANKAQFARRAEAKSLDNLQREIDRSLPRRNIPSESELAAEIQRMTEELTPCR